MVPGGLSVLSYGLNMWRLLAWDGALEHCLMSLGLIILLHFIFTYACLVCPFLSCHIIFNIHNLLCVVPNFYTNIILYAVQQHQSHNHHGCQICPSQWIIADEYICVTCVSELHWEYNYLLWPYLIGQQCQLVRDYQAVRFCNAWYCKSTFLTFFCLC